MAVYSAATTLSSVSTSKLGLGKLGLNEAATRSRCYAEKMSARIDHLLHEVLELAPEERSAVAAALVDSLEGTDTTAVPEAWRRELLIRRDAYRAGEVRASSWAEARARMSAL